MLFVLRRIFQRTGGGRCEGIFQTEVVLLTIGCKDNMFSIKVTLSGDDLQPAMTCTHSVKNIGHIPQGKETSLRYSF